jgi:glycosyltransferase involved in cell wall biosynthesis
MKIVVVTWAYNAEKTIERAINSILEQTYTNFIYYVIDNGSQDRTGELIKNFSQQDNRIRYLRQETNNPAVAPEILLQIAAKYSNEDFYCNLDADDEYLPNFLSEMIDFIQENNLDSATCGTDWIDAESGNIMKHKVIEKNTILVGKDFADLFPYYRNFTTTVWGGLFSMKVLKKSKWTWPTTLAYGSDSATCMEMFSNSTRAGILAKSLHKYYIFPNSISGRYEPKGFSCCKRLYQAGKEYLEHYGPISEQNANYLYVIFFITLLNTVNNVKKAAIPPEKKVDDLYKIFQDEMTQYLLKNWNEIGVRTPKAKLLSDLQEWIFSQETTLEYAEKKTKLLEYIKAGMEI